MQPKAYSPLQPSQPAPGSTPGAPSGSIPAPAPAPARAPQTMSEVLPGSYRTSAAPVTQPAPISAPRPQATAPTPATSTTPQPAQVMPSKAAYPYNAPNAFGTQPAPRPSQNLMNTPAPNSTSAGASPPSDLPPIAPLSTMPANPKPNKPWWFALRGFISFFGFVASVIVLATLINVFLFQSYYVDGTSMNPTLHPDERLIINKLPQSLSKASHSHYTPRRGEIIVFNSELISPVTRKPEQLIKRVIGLPGERVVVKDGKVTIYNQEFTNGFNVDEKLGLKLAATDGDLDQVVPDGHFFVCGDNRAPGGSYDSRYELGTVPSDRIVGELLIRLVPLNKAKIF